MEEGNFKRSSKMKRQIITDLKSLRQTSELVSISDVDKYPKAKKALEGIIKDLEDSLEGQKGIGLTAIQIEIPLQVAIVRIPNKEPVNLINPVIIEKQDKFKFVGEACLSLPGIFVDTLRYGQITLMNNGTKFVAYGLEGIAIQHEVDHMKGILTLDRKWRRR